MADSEICWDIVCKLKDKKPSYLLLTFVWCITPLVLFFASILGSESLVSSCQRSLPSKFAELPISIITISLFLPCWSATLRKPLYFPQSLDFLACVLKWPLFGSSLKKYKRMLPFPLQLSYHDPPKSERQAGATTHPIPPRNVHHLLPSKIAHYIPLQWSLLTHTKNHPTHYPSLKEL